MAGRRHAAGDATRGTSGTQAGASAPGPEDARAGALPVLVAVGGALLWRSRV